MPGRIGFHNAVGMRGRRPGGRTESVADGFERSAPGNLAALVDAWLERLTELAYSPRTVDMHRWALRSFLLWCHQREIVRPETLTKPVLEQYQRWLHDYRRPAAGKGQPLAVNTQRNRLGALQRFFRWLCRENVLAANPAADLDLPRKAAPGLPKALSRGELKALLAIPDTGDLLGIRDRCILELLYSCGLRRRELVNLDIDDVDLEREVLTVRHGKGGRARALPLGGQAVAWLHRYLEDARRQLEVDAEERALFISGYGHRLSPSYLGTWVKRSMNEAGIDKPGSCHLLRHTCATHMHDNGADIRDIQKLLGHVRLDTTQIYTEVSIARLQRVHARTHPHGRA